jgi:hypothetical protein
MILEENKFPENDWFHKFDIIYTIIVPTINIAYQNMHIN